MIIWENRHGNYLCLGCVCVTNESHFMPRKMDSSLLMYYFDENYYEIVKTRWLKPKMCRTAHNFFDKSGKVKPTSRRSPCLPDTHALLDVCGCHGICQIDHELGELLYIDDVSRFVTIRVNDLCTPRHLLTERIKNGSIYMSNWSALVTLYLRQGSWYRYMR